MHWVWVLGLSVLLGGCSQNSSEKKEEKKLLSVKLNPSSLAMFVRNGNVKLGESIDNALRNIPRSDTAINLNTLPAVLSTPFKAHGWEEGNDAYAFILLNEVIYLALQTHDQVNREYIDQVLSQYQKTFFTPNKKVSGSFGTYWFWENNGQRLMICQTKDINQKWSVTIALGVDQLMSRLRMDPISAQKDLISILKK